MHIKNNINREGERTLLAFYENSSDFVFISETTNILPETKVVGGSPFVNSYHL